MRGLAVLLGLWSAVSMAEEPCRAEGDRVSCDRAAFDKLTKKIIDARAERDVLKIKLDAALADGSDANRALSACLSKPPPEPVVLRPSALRSIGPVILGTVGAVALGVSVAGDFGSSGRAVGAVVGSALVGAGVIWALP